MKSTKIKTKTEKGITLIALIITIVVLLILAVVAINSIQNDGILSHAGNVANTYNQAVLNEQQQLQNYLDYLDENSGPKTYETYEIWDEVKLKDTSKETGTFYVIQATDETQKNVVLLAAESINTTDLTQGNADKVVFSTEVYWSSTGTIEETISPIPESHIAAKAAYDYGAKVGGTGRLITRAELQPIFDVLGYDGMINSEWVSYCERFDTEYGDYFVVCTDGTNSGAGESYTNLNYVRPVVEISKDLIESVNAE